MMLREIANDLGLHESTISRATSNKYRQSARGTYEFKHFFSQKMATKSGGSCSAAAVRARIREMIATENGQAPLSDAMVADRLSGEGIVVARRAVDRKSVG